MGKKRRPRMQAQRPQQQAYAEPQQADPSLDDDQLTIPAFLRRQAN